MGHTGQGHTACIKQHFGAFWAWFACVLLVIECFFAMMSEMSGIAAVGELWGLNRSWATVLSASIIVAVVVFCNYRQIEVIGVVFGLFELVFVLTMFLMHPSPRDVFLGSLEIHTEPEYMKLVSANIGAVIMPWIVYFQQSAVVARGLSTKKDLASERTQTLIGSVLTQLVMIGTLVTLAAAHNVSKDLEKVQDIVKALSPVLGDWVSKVFVSLGFLGGSICAAFVVSLAAAWALCEAKGWDTAGSLNEPPLKRPHFYCCFLAVILIGIIVLLTGVNVVKLNVFVELLDGVLMPFAVGFLFLLATGDALPAEVRVVGCHKWLLAILFSLCSALSVCSACYSLLG